MISRKLTQIVLSLAALVVLAMSALAQSPGIKLTEGANSPVSDQKAGSILLYNLYASNSANTVAEDTNIVITNTNSVADVAVHLFFVSSDCSVRDFYGSLTRNQTVRFAASDYDPDTMGYLVVVAVNSAGEPISFNHLIGESRVKLASGHSAWLNAEAIAAINSQDRAVLVPATSEAVGTIRFDGTMYNRLPRLLAVDNIASRADGNDTLLVVNGIGPGSSLATGMKGAGSVFALLYDDAENGYSTSFNVPCQLKRSMSDSFPSTAPRFSSVIPQGRSGWLKFYTTNSAAGILGAVINKGAYNSGHNLHKLTYAESISVELPIFPL